VPPQVFDSYFKQIIVTPATWLGLTPTGYNFSISDDVGEIFRENDVTGVLNTVIDSEGNYKPPFELPVEGAVTLDGEFSTRDEAFTIRIVYI